PNASAIVGVLYTPEDLRRDAGFSIYYMGINLGGFLGPLVVGFLGQGELFRDFLARVGIAPGTAWHFGFASSAVGMLCGVVVYVMRSPRLKDAGLRPSAPKSPEDAMRSRRILAG